MSEEQIDEEEIKVKKSLKIEKEDPTKVEQSKLKMEREKTQTMRDAWVKKSRENVVRNSNMDKNKIKIVAAAIDNFYAGIATKFNMPLSEVQVLVSRIIGCKIGQLAINKGQAFAGNILQNHFDNVQDGYESLIKKHEGASI